MAEPDKLTHRDLSMIEYFHKMKGDITRWAQWEEKKPLIKEEYPELIDALERVEIAEKTLNKIVDSIV